MMKAIQKIIDLPLPNSPNLVKILREKNTNPISFNKLILPSEDGYLFLNYGDIIRCEASSNYTMVYQSDKPVVIIAKTLKWVEDKIKDPCFFRVHQSHLININYLSKYEKRICPKVWVSGKALPVSKSKRSLIENLLTL